MQKLVKHLYRPGFGLLLIRLALAAAFLAHGIGKLANMDGVIGFFGSIGLAPFWAWVVAIVETVAGAAMLFGAFTTIAGILLAVIMLVAIFKAKMGGGFMGVELEFVLLVTSLGIALAGPGKWALSRKMCNCECGDCKDGVCTGMWGMCGHGHGKGNTQTPGGM